MLNRTCERKKRTPGGEKRGSLDSLPFGEKVLSNNEKLKKKKG